MVELGLPQLVAENYFGVSGPAGLPKEVTDKLAAALAEIIARPDIVKRFEELGHHDGEDARPPSSPASSPSRSTTGRRPSRRRTSSLRFLNCRRGRAAQARGATQHQLTAPPW